MKLKQLFSFSLLLFSMMGIKSVSFAQNDTAKFEFPNVPVTGFWDGDDFSGGFQSGPAYFTNAYDTSFGFGFWSAGFAWSTLTDSITSGFGNQMSVKAAGGHNSPGYGIGLQNSITHITNNGLPAQPQSVRICNSTYAYNSMRDGDTFAKKFGGLTGNDPDFFKLLIKPYLSGNLLTDSVEFYLADFRFNNNSQDYIVNTWDLVDLSSLPMCDSLVFTLSSSDNGSFGMNTPAYFCLDDLVISNNPNGVNTNLFVNRLEVFPNPGNGSALMIKTSEKEPKTYHIYNAVGAIAANGIIIESKNIDVSEFNPGVYFIHILGNSENKIVQWVKQ
jgi:hypothetical protein